MATAIGVSALHACRHGPTLRASRRNTDSRSAPGIAVTDKPTRHTTDGRAYLDLRKLAALTKRPTDELLQLYALEGFLERLTNSPYVKHFVLKGGMLLAAFDSRRPTRDVDFAALDVSNDVEEIRGLVTEIASIDNEDGLLLDGSSATAQMIRDGDDYSGVRVNLLGTLATAVVHFHVDVNVGDPITPQPRFISLPRLLGGALPIVGYPIEMVLSEKIVTAVQRGVTNTRWRDFVDIDRLVRVNKVSGSGLTTSIGEVASHRSAALHPLSEVLDRYSAVAQVKWQAWRRKQLLQPVTPEQFGELLDVVVAFADPVLTRSVDHISWNPVTRSWEAFTADIE